MAKLMGIISVFLLLFCTFSFAEEVYTTSETAVDADASADAQVEADGEVSTTNTTKAPGRVVAGVRLPPKQQGDGIRDIVSANVKDRMVENTKERAMDEKKRFEDKVMDRAKGRVIDQIKDQARDRLRQSALIVAKARLESSADGESKRLILARHLEAKSDAEVGVSEYAELKGRFDKASKEEKDELREELKAKAGRALLAQIEAILARLAAIKENVDDTTKVDEAIKFFEEKKAKLESGDYTREDLIKISVEIRAFWKTHKFEVKKKVGREVSVRLENLISKTEKILARLSAKIADLKAQGKDTARLEAGVEKINSDLNRLENAIATLKEEYADADKRSEVSETIKSAHRLLQAAHKQLQSDLLLLRSLIKATSELGASVAISAATTSELEVLEEEGSEVVELEVAAEEIVQVADSESSEIEVESEVESETESESEGSDDTSAQSDTEVV